MLYVYTTSTGAGVLVYGFARSAHVALGRRGRVLERASAACPRRGRGGGRGRGRGRGAGQRRDGARSAASAGTRAGTGRARVNLMRAK